MWTVVMFVIGAAMSEEIMSDQAVLARSWELLRSARYGYDDRERAAFVVRGPNGALETVAWPYGAVPFRATWGGAMPAGTIAIIHTHPNIHPYPSRGDELLAQRNGISVYVLTRTQVTRTDGNRSYNVRIGDWNPTASR